MMTPNLDATGRQWVGVLARFNFQLEYQKGCNNTVADVLELNYYPPQPRHSEIHPCWNNPGAAHRMEIYEPTTVEGDHDLDQEVCVATGCMLVEMHVTDWEEAQREDPVLSTVLDWMETQKKTDLKTLLEEHASSEEGRLILQNQHNFIIHQKALYPHSMPKGKNVDLLLFVVPKTHQVAALNGCHRGYRTSGPWLYSVPIAGMLLVARND